MRVHSGHVSLYGATTLNLVEAFKEHFEDGRTDVASAELVAKRPADIAIPLLKGTDRCLPDIFLGVVETLD